MVEGAKLCLCFNSMHVSAHAEYVPFKYERIGEMTDNTGAGDYHLYHR